MVRVKLLQLRALDISEAPNMTDCSLCVILLVEDSSIRRHAYLRCSAGSLPRGSGWLLSLSFAVSSQRVAIGHGGGSCRPPP